MLNHDNNNLLEALKFVCVWLWSNGQIENQSNKTYFVYIENIFFISKKLHQNLVLINHIVKYLEFGNFSVQMYHYKYNIIGWLFELR